MQTKTKEPSALSLKLFEHGEKFTRFKHYYGFNIRKQSKYNFDAILLRLAQRTLIPEIEQQSYGNERLSHIESAFFDFWRSHIIPLFTYRHGSDQFAYIQHAGCMMSVADRRTADEFHQNSRTGGIARQDYIYAVLGIGPKHPVPTSAASGKTITSHFSRMSAEEKQQYVGMFIGGHDVDYARDITYPIIVCGDTQYKVSYNKTTRLRTTTFKRADGTLITETLSPADEIIAADPNIEVIFEWLGYKMIEYLRFIGGDFQKEILTCNNIDKLAFVFHTLFPSYRFPELKIPLKKIPLSAQYIEVNNSCEVSYKEATEFHNACEQFDLHKVSSMINPVIASVPGRDDNTPLTTVMKARGQYSLQLVQLLLDNNVDPNAGTFLDSNLSLAINMGIPDLIAILMRGASHPHCANLRLLPKVGYVELKTIIESHQLQQFEQFYPHYLEYDSPQKLLSLACRNVIETVKKYGNNHKLNERAQQDFDQSIQILERILQDSDPNCDGETENVLCQAAQNGKLRVVTALLKHSKLNINQKTTGKAHKVSANEGWTALHYACWKGHADVVNSLLDAGIDVNARAYSGMTALAVIEDVLAGKMDFMTQQDRYSERLTNNNLSMFFGSGIGEQKLSSDDEARLGAIISALKLKGAIRDLAAENEIKPQGTYHAVVGCVVADFQNKKYVLLVRKKNTLDQASGMFLFPGGFYDNSKDNGDFAAGAIREVREETGVDLSKAICTTLAKYENQVHTVEIKHQFFLFDLGYVDRLPYCLAKSDVGDAQWISFDQIEKSLSNGALAMNFKGISIKHSNAIILDALKLQQLPDEHAIIAAQKLSMELTPENIASSLFLTFHLREAYSSRDQLMDVFIEMRAQIPQGYLQGCFDELLQVLKEDKGEEAAKVCIQNFITHLVKTGICNIEDLRHKDIPLLHLTCMSRKTSAIIWLLDQGADINSIFTDGINRHTPLSFLITVNDLDSARIAIERFGADINLGVTTESAITIAASQPNIPDDFIEYLIKQSGVITDEQLGTIIHELIRTQRIALLDKMLSQFHIDLNREYYRRQMLSDKYYPILTAINIYSLECVKLLAKYGADLTLLHRPNSNLVQFAQHMSLTLKSQQMQLIARLPNHPQNLAEPHYYSSMKSFYAAENNLSEEELMRLLKQSEKNISEIEQIIAYLKSFQPAEALAPTTLEELVASFNI